MPRLAILIVLVLTGLVLWLANNYIPMDHKIKTIFNVVVVIVVIVWFLKVFGVMKYLMDVNV